MENTVEQLLEQLSETFISAKITIGKIGDGDIDDNELGQFVDEFLRLVDEHGFQCASRWRLVRLDETGEPVDLAKARANR